MLATVRGFFGRSQSKSTYAKLAFASFVASGLSILPRSTCTSNKEENARRSLISNIMNDEPESRDYKYSNRVLYEVKEPSKTLPLIALLCVAPAVPYLLGMYICKRAKLGFLSIPILSYYLYKDSETYNELSMLLLKLELPPTPSPTTAQLTTNIFWPTTRTIQISECRQLYKFMQEGSRMNYFQCLDEQNKLVTFVRFDYDNNEVDPTKIDNPSLFHDVLQGRIAEVAKYEYNGI